MSYQTQDQSLLGSVLQSRFQGSHAVKAKSNAPMTRLRPFTYHYQDGPGCGSCVMADKTEVVPVTPRVHASTSQNGNSGGYKTLDSYCSQSDGYKSCPQSIRYD
jgi:hypothetical protein